MGVGAVVAGLVTALVWLVAFSPVLSVRHVEVEGVSGPAAGELRRLAGVPAGLPLARVDTDEARRRVLSRPELAEVSVRRSWPSTIRILVEPRVPRLVLRDGSVLRIADASGSIYRTIEKAPPGLPVVTVSGTQATSPRAVRAALSLVDALPADLARRVGTITVSSGDLVRFRVGSVEVVWGGAEQSERKAELVALLLRTNPKRIDVSAPDTPATS